MCPAAARWSGPARLGSSCRRMISAHWPGPLQYSPATRPNVPLWGGLDESGSRADSPTRSSPATPSPSIAPPSPTKAVSGRRSKGRKTPVIEEKFDRIIISRRNPGTERPNRELRGKSRPARSRGRSLSIRADHTDGSGSLLFVGPAKALWGANIFPYWGPLENGLPLFLLFFTGNYQRGWLLLRRSPGRRVAERTK